jgi:predicted PurR-regulated permease PerM
LAPRVSLAALTALVVLLGLTVLGAAVLLARVADVLVLVLVAAILASGLTTPVEALRRRRWGRRGWRLGRGAAIVLVLLGAGAAALVATAALVTPLVGQVDAFIAQVPATVESAVRAWDRLREPRPWLPDLSGVLERLLVAAEQLGRVLGTAAAGIVRALSGLVSGVVVVVLCGYMLADGPKMKAGTLGLLPAAARARADAVLGGIETRFGGWVRGQLVLCVVAGVAAGLGSWALGLPSPLLLGLFAGVTMLVPMIGPALGAVPPVLIALFGPWERLVATIVVFVAIFQVEMNVVAPRVMARAVGLSPLLTIVAVAAGAALLGMAGALLAVPVAAALRVVLEEVLPPARGR